jgi:hypothetical protein
MEELEPYYHCLIKTYREEVCQSIEGQRIPCNCMIV